MAVKVETITTCDKCGYIHHRDGAEGSVPPVTWAEVNLNYRLKGSGWTNCRSIQKTLCPECAKQVEIILQGEIKWQK